MAQRLLTALVGLPVLLAVLWAGTPYLTVVVALAALVGWLEYHRMFSLDQGRIELAAGSVWVVLLAVSGQFTSHWEAANLPLLSYAVLGGGGLLALPWLVWHRKNVAQRLRLAAGPVYVGFLLAHALALRQVDDGSDLGFEWLLFALLTTFATDSGAYLMGRAVGRHAMVPSISPGKTWEGGVGGLLSAVAAGTALAALLGLPVGSAIGVAAGVGVVGQLGDLLESRLKRVAGVKDTSTLLPGHGGVLDRLDSLVLATPLVYYLVILVVER